jgi:hypothetical protein
MTIHMQELSALRDGLIRALAMLQDEITARENGSDTFSPSATSTSTNSNSHSTDRIIAQYYQSTSGAPLESISPSTINPDVVAREVKLALGLLLKHRGGPGFGHGRLEGKELALLEDKLRNVVQLLKMETLSN